MSPSDIFFLDIYFVLGVVPIDTVLYIAVVTKAELKGKILGNPVYEIKAAELIEFNRSDRNLNSDPSKTSILNLLSSGFFFSYSYRLTLSIGAVSNGTNLHDQSNKNFY